MNQEKIGNFIKNVRKQNNLTQKELAEKLGVTYQAVSKWENGLNIPDIGIIRELSNMYNVDVNELLDVKKIKKSDNKIVLTIIIILLLTVGIISFFIIKSYNSQDIKIDSLSTTCTDFKITGSAAYNDKKTSIYISNIDYCGVNDDTIYDNITCTLYEDNSSKKTEISKCDDFSNLTIKEYLNNISIRVNNHSSDCIINSKLYLEIIASKSDYNKEYIIPIKLDGTCN